MFKKYIHFLLILVSMSLAAGLQGAAHSGLNGSDLDSADLKRSDDLLDISHIKHAYQRRVTQAQEEIRLCRLWERQGVSLQEIELRAARLRKLRNGSLPTVILEPKPEQAVDEESQSKQSNGLIEEAAGFTLKFNNTSVQISGLLLNYWPVLQTAFSVKEETELDLSDTLLKEIPNIEKNFQIFMTTITRFHQVVVPGKSEEWLKFVLTNMSAQEMISFVNFCDYLGDQAIIDVLIKDGMKLVLDVLEAKVKTDGWEQTLSGSLHLFNNHYENLLMRHLSCKQRVIKNYISTLGCKLFFSQANNTLAVVDSKCSKIILYKATSTELTLLTELQLYREISYNNKIHWNPQGTAFFFENDTRVELYSWDASQNRLTLRHAFDGKGMRRLDYVYWHPKLQSAAVVYTCGYGYTYGGSLHIVQSNVRGNWCKPHCVLDKKIRANCFWQSNFGWHPTENLFVFLDNNKYYTARWVNNVCGIALVDCPSDGWSRFKFHPFKTVLAFTSNQGIHIVNNSLDGTNSIHLLENSTFNNNGFRRFVPFQWLFDGNLAIYLPSFRKICIRDSTGESTGVEITLNRLPFEDTFDDIDDFFKMMSVGGVILLFNDRLNKWIELENINFKTQRSGQSEGDNNYFCPKEKIMAYALYGTYKKSQWGFADLITGKNYILPLSQPIYIGGVEAFAGTDTFDSGTFCSDGMFVTVACNRSDRVEVLQFINKQYPTERCKKYSTAQLLALNVYEQTVAKNNNGAIVQSGQEFLIHTLKIEHDIVFPQTVSKQIPAGVKSRWAHIRPLCIAGAYGAMALVGTWVLWNNSPSGIRS